jgi:hypothetical protein
MPPLIFDGHPSRSIHYSKKPNVSNPPSPAFRHALQASPFAIQASLNARSKFQAIRLSDVVHFDALASALISLKLKSSRSISARFLKR